MNNKYTAVIKQEGDWWLGWIEEIPGVNCQETSHDELVETLRITLQEVLAFNREEALLNAGTHYRDSNNNYGIFNKINTMEMNIFSFFNFLPQSLPI